ncbi:MAG: ISNCY family transposase, partial [Prevotella sp.]|nr:ISNCY family transposase [Prevotella sp.]
MRKRFEPQTEIGRLLIEDTPTPRSRDGMVALVIALRELYKNTVYRNRILDILEAKLITGKPRTGRPGMDLWTMFVLAQIRLSKQLSYDELHVHANYNRLVRQVTGVEREPGFEEITFPYQTIVDNVSLLDDEALKQINDVIVSFGHGEVFKKKEAEALRLKTDSFVVESNVHFPTDYNLLWDCIRKCLDIIGKLEEKHGRITGWRKSGYWHSELKSLMRQLGRAC